MAFLFFVIVSIFTIFHLLYRVWLIILFNTLNLTALKLSVSRRPEHLGHADIHITAGTYTAVLDSSPIKTATFMEQFLTAQTQNNHQLARIK